MTAGPDEPLLVVDKLQELQTAVDDEEYGVAVTLSEEVLSLLKNESNADDTTTPLTITLVYEIYVKSLLHQQEYDKVLSLTPPVKDCRPVLEPLQAYAAYRLGQYDKALQHSKGSDEIAPHVRAQTYFNRSETQKALDAYKQLMNSRKEDGDEDDDFLLEVYTNAMAVLTANATPYEPGTGDSKLRNKAHEFVVQSSEVLPYDLAYNIASHDLLKADTLKDRQEALTLLKQAHRECRDINKDDEKVRKQELEPMELNLHWGKTLWGEVGFSRFGVRKHGIADVFFVV